MRIMKALVLSAILLIGCGCSISSKEASVATRLKKALEGDYRVSEDFAKLIRALTAAWDRARDAGAKDVLSALSRLDQRVGDLLTKLGPHIRAAELQRRAERTGDSSG